MSVVDQSQIFAWLSKNTHIWFPDDWQEFYNNIRESSWPDCETWEQVSRLPVDLQTEIFWHHIPNLFVEPVKTHQLRLLAQNSSQVQKLAESNTPNYFESISTWLPDKWANCGGIRVPYHSSMACEGISRLPMFIKVLDMLAPARIFDHCLEWCSGPGFIGYGMLGHGRCKKLDLADIWAPSLDAAKQIQGGTPAQTWHINCINDIPSGQQYDLVVANPPWFPGKLLKHNRATCDVDLQIHRDFFQQIGEYLTPDGLIVLVEGQTYTGPADLLPLLQGTNIEFSKVIASDDNWHWFAIFQHKQP